MTGPGAKLRKEGNTSSTDVSWVEKRKKVLARTKPIFNPEGKKRVKEIRTSG